SLLEVHDQRVGDLREPFDDRVELRGPDAYASTVERCVRAAADHAAAALGDRDPVAVAPDARIFGEVGGPIAAPIRIVPEAGRHRRHGSGDHQLSLLADHGVPVLVERLDAAAEVPAADLPLPDGDQRAGAYDRGPPVGAARDP